MQCYVTPLTNNVSNLTQMQSFLCGKVKVATIKLIGLIFSCGNDRVKRSRSSLTCSPSDQRCWFSESAGRHLITKGAK